MKNGGDFIDDDKMNITVDTIQIERADSNMLEWLFILQDTSNSLPFSRFAHNRGSVMTVRVDKFLFSAQPDSPAKNRNASHGITAIINIHIFVHVVESKI